MSKAEDTQRRKQAFLKRFAAGETIVSICTDPTSDSPSTFTIYHWRKTDPEFCIAFDAAKKSNREARGIVNHNRGLGHKHASATDDEHTPEFPAPAGPNPVTLIRRRCEVRQSIREDSFQDRCEIGLRAGRPLRFD